MKTPKVSVVVTAYNHENYITQCLDSILMQKGAFDLEVILGDDCSADRTRQIMQEYAERHPDVFILLPPTANMGVTRNIKRCLDACSGDYIAFCEGDDYWTDTYKLQKQMDFLESHPDYALCFNAIILYYQGESRYAPHTGQLLLEKDTLTTEDLIPSSRASGFSCCMYRTSIVRKLPEEIFDISIADWMFNMACSRLGKVGFIRDWMSVYRIHAKGVWSGKSPIDQRRELLTLIDTYNQFFSYQYDRQFRKQKEGIYKLLYTPQAPSIRKYIRGYGNLFVDAIKHPVKAYNNIRAIISKTAAELNSFVQTRESSQIVALISSIAANITVAPEVSRKLNVGCGTAQLPGWLNIDIELGADLVTDVREGLPFDNNSVHFIYNEHFIEHLSYEECEKVLREFRRCLKKGGVLRIATPDLDSLVMQYNRDFNNSEWFPRGFEFVKTKGMALNMAFSRWGHRFLYNEEELRNQLSKAGFSDMTRCELNKSSYPELSNLETRKESRLIIEAVK